MNCCIWFSSELTAGFWYDSHFATSLLECACRLLHVQTSKLRVLCLWIFSWADHVPVEHCWSSCSVPFVTRWVESTKGLFGGGCTQQLRILTQAKEIPHSVIRWKLCSRGMLLHVMLCCVVRASGSTKVSGKEHSRTRFKLINLLCSVRTQTLSCWKSETQNQSAICVCRIWRSCSVEKAVAETWRACLTTCSYNDLCITQTALLPGHNIRTCADCPAFGSQEAVKQHFSGLFRIMMSKTGSFFSLFVLCDDRPFSLNQQQKWTKLRWAGGVLVFCPLWSCSSVCILTNSQLSKTDDTYGWSFQREKKAAVLEILRQNLFFFLSLEDCVIDSAAKIYLLLGYGFFWVWLAPDCGVEPVLCALCPKLMSRQCRFLFISKLPSTLVVFKAAAFRRAAGWVQSQWTNFLLLWSVLPMLLFTKPTDGCHVISCNVPANRPWLTARTPTLSKSSYEWLIRESNGSWQAGSRGLFARTMRIARTMHAVRCRGLVDLWSVVVVQVSELLKIRWAQEGSGKKNVPVSLSFWLF